MLNGLIAAQIGRVPLVPARIVRYQRSMTEYDVPCLRIGIQMSIQPADLSAVRKHKPPLVGNGVQPHDVNSLQ